MNARLHETGYDRANTLDSFFLSTRRRRNDLFFSEKTSITVTIQVIDRQTSTSNIAATLSLKF